MRVLTLNAWGAPYAKDIRARLKAICEQMPTLQPDVILLQEVFLNDDREVVRGWLAGGWPHQHYFSSGLLGSGLLTASRYPIVDAAFHRFRLGGKPERVLQGDFYAGKGIGMTRIETPDGLVAVFNVHTHAQYEVEDDNEYAVYTNTNLYEAARFVATQAGGDPVILGGDLNSRPDQAGYRLLKTLANLRDSHFEAHGNHPVTYAEGNAYTAAKRDFTLDYLLVRGMTVKAAERVMDGDSPAAGILAYSDHYGVMADVVPDEDTAITDDGHAVAIVLADLHQQVRLGAAEARNERDAAFERGGLAAAGLLDVWLTSGLIGRWLPGLGRWLRRWLSAGLIGYAVMQALFGLIGLQPRVQILDAIENELKHQIEARRAFDGREW